MPTFSVDRIGVIFSRRWLSLALLITWAIRLTVPASAEDLSLPELRGDSLVGRIQTVLVRPGESLLDIARAFDIGHDQIIGANPSINRWVPEPGTRVIIPSRYILPSGPRSGIVLNLGELRMYYYPPNTRAVWTFPVSIGDFDWETPIGTTRIIAKEREPAWSPPASIRAEHAAESEPLPTVIPGGDPDNPLGHYAFRLGIKGYLIHGTDERRSYGIGMRVSHGCIRMYPEDIAFLFEHVKVGTQVRIINEPVKYGTEFNAQFIEIHQVIDSDFEQLATEEIFNLALQLIEAYSPSREDINPRALARSAILATGIPARISFDHEYN